MKKIHLLSITLFFAIHINAQSTAYLKIANTGSIEKIEHVSTGGYITIGADSVYKSQVIRWDANFNPMWKCKFTDANIAGSPQRIVEANDGNFYYMNTSNEHSGCAFIAKLSSTGSIIWQKNYYETAGSLYSYALSKAAGTDNGFLFGGGQCSLSNYVIKCDANGNIIWQNQYLYPLSTGVITCWSIIPEANGYVVSAGYNINSLLTFKLDVNGGVTAQTAYTYSSKQILPLRMVKLNTTGGYAIVGNYNNSNDNKTEFVAFYNSALSLLSFNELTVTYTQFTLNDITAINNGKNVVVNGSVYDGSAFTTALINLSNSGNVEWKKRSQGATSMSNKNVEFRGITTNGNYTVSGGAGYYEGCVMAIVDTSGNGLCNNTQFDMQNIHPALALQSSVITVAAANALAVAVSYTNTPVSATTKYLYCGSLSIGDDGHTQAENEIQLFPNPAVNELAIKGIEKWPAIVTIYSLTGQQLSKITLDGPESKVPVEFLHTGYYLLNISSGDDNVNNTLLPFIKE